MNQETRTYRLKVESPVHIGCGTVYEPTSFVIKEEAKTLVAFNPFHFLESLGGEKMAQFSSLCQQGTVESLLDIYTFIRHNGQHVEGLEVAVGDNFLQHYRSVLAKPKHLIAKELNSFLINRTAFNPLTGNVYIPGSSFKGSLRTAILNERHKKNPQTGSFKGKWASSELQKRILDGGQFETDPFSRLKVSDFRPVAAVRRKIVYGVDRKKKPGKFEASAPYQIFEVIEPGALFEGTITLQAPDDRAGVRSPVTFREIETALASFYIREYKREQAEAANIGVEYKYHLSDNHVLLRLGRHSGAECVTIEGQRQIKIMASKGGKTKTLAAATTIWFAANSSKSKTNTALKPFGWVSISPATHEQIAQGKAYDDQERKKRSEKKELALKKLEEAKHLSAKKKEQERLALLEKQRAEAEALKYPWRAWLKTLDKITDWGMFRQLVLDNEKTKSWQKEPEVYSAVVKLAESVRCARPDKWDEERDAMTAAWFEGTGVTWQSLAEKEADKKREEDSDSPVLAQIKAYRDWGHFKQEPIDYNELDNVAAAELMQKLKDWGCNNKKAKKDKQKAWKELQAVARRLK